MRYQIPAPNFQELTETIEKLTKKANKLHSTPITMEIVDTIEKEDDGKLYKWLVVEIAGDTPMLNGWKFAAKLEHLPEGNIVRSLTDFDLPERFRTLEPNCEYCNKKRNRKDTYVVYNDQGEFVQVGTSCLKDFTGHADPHAVAEWLEILAEVQSSCQEAQDYDPDASYGGSSAIRLDTYLAYVSMSIREHGYIKTSEGGVYYASTRDESLGKMFTKYNREYPDEKDTEVAKSTIEFVRNQLCGKSDYEWNLIQIFKTEYIEYSHCGYAASAVSVYLKNLERNTEFSNSQFVGQVKKRQEFKNLTCVNITYIDGYYGTTNLHKFVDESGNLLVWFSSSVELEQGETYSGKATVKEHKVYNGINQTVLTRCKFS